MDLLLAFVVFGGTMIVALVLNWSMAWPLVVGLLVFVLTGIRRRHSFFSLMRMVYLGGRTSFVVLRILIFIGILTALWRSAGTISFFVYYGISLITPTLFLLLTFLITLVLSFALGTSFGIAGTAGVLLMVLAKSGGVDPAITAGVIMSGAYFGDRCSPASSSASLVAAVTQTDLYTNVKRMLVTGILPTLITLGIYAILSFRNPLGKMDSQILEALSTSYNLSICAALPAVAILILPLFRVPVIHAMAVSIVIGFLDTLFLQKESLLFTLKACFLGYAPTNQALGNVMAGGGLVSMVEVIIIVFISCTYSGIFDGTGMLVGSQEKIGKLADLVGLFPTQIVASFLSIAVFCNQTVATILNAQLLGGVYEKKGGSSFDLAMDMENSVITLSGIVPWSIACTVPLGILGVGIEAIPYSFLLYLIPFTYLFTKRIWVKKY
jgi:NhaC family Na+:H+ antiporter